MRDIGVAIFAAVLILVGFLWTCVLPAVGLLWSIGAIH